jgi:hypothetical protein
MFVISIVSVNLSSLTDCTEQAISQSEHVWDTQSHLSHIASATRGIIFLGTPHRGSNMTSLGKVVARVSQIVLRNANVNLITDLERDSQTLDRIRDNFSRVLHKHTLTIWSFVEELSISGLGRVRIPFKCRGMWADS